MSQSIDQQLSEQMGQMTLNDSSRALVVVQPPAPVAVAIPLPDDDDEILSEISEPVFPSYDELLGYDIQQIKDIITPFITDTNSQEYQSIDTVD